MMIAAIIQARMTSTRLPGKVLKEVFGKPLLSYQIERLRKVDNIEEIIVATTTNKEDDPIIQLCEKESIVSFRGSEQDVLERYYQAALQYQVDAILRITSDCPLLDSDIVKKVIAIYQDRQIDYVHLGPTFAEGLDCEIFSFPVLEVANKNAKMQSEREHVTLYFHNHPDLFNKIVVENETDDSKYRFTVDEPEDFQVVKAIIEALYKRESMPFNFKEIKEFLDGHPDIFKKNAHIIRNEGLLKSLSLEAD